MAPPLISEYKQNFVFKRLFETFLGGPRLFSPLSFVAIQIFLYSIPAFVVSLVNLLFSSVELKWKSVIIGVGMCLIDISLALIILLLKKGRSNVVQSLPSVRVSDADGSKSESSEVGESTERIGGSRPNHEHVTSFLSQEDMVPNEGCHKQSTWIYIAPNPKISVSYLVTVAGVGLTFVLCTPLMISEVLSPVLRGFVIFALCNAHYSAIINSPPEIAIFNTASPEKRNMFYRIFYALLIGLIYIIFAQISSDPENHCWLSYLGGMIAFFPLLWGIGLLPDPSALFPWGLGTLLLLLGGTSPSFHPAGTLLSLVVVVLCPILVFVITQHPLKIVLAECICGYIISCDTGRIVSLNSALCEDIPTTSFLRQLLWPCLNVASSLLVVFLSWTFLGTDVAEPSSESGDILVSEIVLITTTLTIAFASWAFRYWALSRTQALGKAALIPVHLCHGTLTFLLHTWLTLTIQQEKLSWSSVQESETHTQSLLRLLPYLLTIRGFALSISEPRKSTIDFSLAFWAQTWLDESKGKSSFVLILFTVSLISGRIKRFFRAWKTFCSIWYAFGICNIMGSEKTRLLILSVTLLPISLLSLTLAVLVEGLQLIPIFTLPIFLLGFPRPSSSFWSETWFPGRAEGRKGRKSGGGGGGGKHVVEVETLDWKIYSEIGPLLASGLSRRAHVTKFALERGDCFLARYEDRLLFTRVVAVGWNYVYLQIKGLEMQEQTSCHHHEAAKVDEIFDAVLGEERSTCSMLTLDFLSLLILSPMCSLNLPTYSESKSNIYALAIPEEKSTFRDMFYRAFSYMWIKNNPALKGEAYQNGLHKKTIAAEISTNSFATSHDAVPSTDGNNLDTDQQEMGSSSGSVVKPDQFSVKHALVNFTKPTVDFFKRRDSMDPSRRGSMATTTIVSAVSGADASEKVKEPDVSSLLEDEDVPEPVRRRSVISRQSTVTSLSMSQKDFAPSHLRRFSITAPTPARLVDVESESGSGGQFFMSNNSGKVGNSGNGPGEGSKDPNARLSTIWVKQCVGDVIPSNAVKARVEKICNSVWDTVVGMDEENEIELSEFFHDDFLLKLKRLSSSPRVDMEQITLKAFRYACKLTLDEIFSSTNYATKVITIDADQEEEIFTQLNQFEREYQFCSPQEIPFWMQQNASHIVTMNKSEEKSIMRILNYEQEGVEFKIGQLDQFTAEGIWGNLNLELLYLTSDDDERFSIQNDRVLLRNMMTQCAKNPLGYPVYDCVFLVNLHSFNATQIN